MPNTKEFGKTEIFHTWMCRYFSQLPLALKIAATSLLIYMNVVLYASGNFLCVKDVRSEVCAETLYHHNGNRVETLLQAIFLDTWLETQASTVSGNFTDIHGDRADLASGNKEVQYWLFSSRHCQKLEGVNLNEV